MSYDDIRIKGERLFDKAREDLSLDKSNLDVESLRTPALHSEWIKILYQWKDLLRSLDNRYKGVYKEKWIYYSGKDEPSVYKLEPFDLKILKSDLNIFLDSDTRLSNIKQQIDLVKDIISLIEGVIGEINRRSFHIKNTISWLQFTNGGNI